jgi:hypothetical protein
MQEIASDPHTATNTGLRANFTHERKTKPADRQPSLAIPMCQCEPALCRRTKFSLNIHNLLYAMTLDAPLMSEDIERDAKGLGEKMKGGAKAAGEKISDTAKDAGEKISDTGKDAEAEAKKAKENVKEKVD